MPEKVNELKESLDKLASGLSSVAELSKKKPKEAQQQLSFIVSQLESLQNEIDSLDKAISFGAPLAEYEASTKRLSEIEGMVSKLEVKLDTLVDEVSKLRKEQEILKSLFQEGISERQIKVLESRIKNIEELQQKLMNTKSMQIMAELVQVVDELNKRVAYVEELIKSHPYEVMKNLQQMQSTEKKERKPETKKESLFNKIRSALYGKG